MAGWMKFAMLFVMGIVMVVGLGDNSETDAGWYPGKYVGRVVVNGVHRRQDRRAARREARGCGGAEVQVQAVAAYSDCGRAEAVQYSACDRSVEAAVPAPVLVESYTQAATTIQRGMAPLPKSKPESADFTPEDEARLRDSIADMRNKLRLLEEMVEIRKKLVSH